MHPHISVEGDGQARISGTRYKVLHLAGEHFHFGWSAEEILRQHPDLERAQAYAALTYFYDHYDALCDALKNATEQVIALRGVAEQTGHFLSRDELLRRRELIVVCCSAEEMSNTVNFLPLS